MKSKNELIKILRESASFQRELKKAILHMPWKDICKKFNDNYGENLKLNKTDLTLLGIFIVECMEINNKTYDD